MVVTSDFTRPTIASISTAWTPTSAKALCLVLSISSARAAR